jgi:hypothetical protein
MQRQKLLRQLDQEFDVALRENVRQRAALEDMKRRMDQFKEEENQRVPKWAKRINEGDPRVRLGHWYKVLRVQEGNCGLEIRDENGEIWHSAYPVERNIWQLCYDNNPPEAVASKEIHPSYRINSLNVLDTICSLGGLRTVTFFDDQSGHVSNGDHERMFSFGSFSEFVEKAARMKHE